MSTLVSTIIRSGGTAGALVYQGVWNANTNTPAIVNGVGNKGQYYKVSVNGTTNIDGISTWYAGDIIAFNGTTWDKIDGIPDEVLAVNGQTGNVSITNITGNAATASTATTQLYSDSSTKIATTAFVHDVVANDTGHLSIAGGTMLGSLTLASNPVSALQAATKQYVDNQANPGVGRIVWTDYIDVAVPAYNLAFADVKVHSFTTPANCSLTQILYRTSSHHSNNGLSVEWRLLLNGVQIAYTQTNATSSDNLVCPIFMSSNIAVNPSTTYTLTLQALNYSSAGNIWTNGGQNSSSNVPMGQSEIDLLYF